MGQRRGREFFWVLLPIVVAAMVAPLGSVSGQSARWKVDAEKADRGQKIFVSNCSFCHGANARGSEHAPDLVQSELVNRDEQGELIGQVLAKGRPDRGMPAFPTLVPQAADVAGFLHAQILAVGNRMGYAIDAGKSGDPRAGERFFKGAGGCGACHSVTGDLAHIATKYKPDQLEGAIAFPGPTVLYYVGIKIRPVARPPVAVKVVTPDKATYSGTAVFLGEYDISLRTADGQYRSFARTPDLRVEIDDPLDGHRKLVGRYSDADLHNLTAYLMELK